jgi:hypothetical protein
MVGSIHGVSGLIDVTTAPKAKKRKTEQPEEAEDDEEEVVGEDDGEVDGKDLEDDEADAGEEDADEDVSSRLCHFTWLSWSERTGTSTNIDIRLPTLRRPVALRLLPKRPRAKTYPRRPVSAKLTMPSKCDAFCSAVYACYDI